MKVLVTGTAGFIGSSLAKRLLARGDEVVGVDNLNDYYDVQIKKDRLAQLLPQAGFTDVRANIEDKAAIDKIFKEHKPDRVVNLAAPNTWCMRPAAPCMAPTPLCRFPCTTTWITRSASTLPAKKPTN